MAEYIEREKAIDSLLGWAEQLAETYGKNDEYVLCLQAAADGIEQIPAADVRPVVRGKWELSDDRCWHTCSICGADIDVSVGLLCYVDNEEVCNHNFCPNCGADMRETT